jgi:coenzyme F420-reducing hydrogenase beta subunit
VAAELLRRGLVDGVAHVVPVEPGRNQGRFFQYQISRSIEAVRGGAKSRYYPVELSSVLRQIRSGPGRYAIVGIPCFIKAIHLACAEEPLLRERIAFTLGLYCGHMKSARFVESFAWQMGADMHSVDSVEYRVKNPDRPANWYTARLTLKDGTSRERDWWHLVDGDWGSGFFQNSACDFCDDVIAETADISFGDAWVEPYSSDGRGTNVVVVRSALLHDILREAIDERRVDLRPVDSAFVLRTQEAGFRQRREGLSFRMRRFPPALRPRKRVSSDGQSLSARRVFVYIMRREISVWSHRVFAAARQFGTPALYTRWARATLTVYRGLTYSAGWIGWFIDHLGFGRGG